MNKIYIILLCTYIVFMSCRVKKQIDRSKSLSAGLLQWKVKTDGDVRQSFHYSGKVADSLFAMSAWKSFSVDSIDWAISDTPYIHLLKMWGIRIGTGKTSRNGKHRSEVIDNDHLEESISITDTLNKRVRKERQALRKSIVKLKSTWKVLLALAGLLGGLALIYIYRKKIFSFLP